MTGIQIKLKEGGVLAYDPQSGAWRADEAGKWAEWYANEVASDYRYSPADGNPGVKLANMIVSRLGGQVIAPDFPWNAEALY